MKLLIAGGGTGGHIYPAISMARSFLKKYPQAQVEFVGTPGGLECKIIPRENFKLHLISIGKLNFSGNVFKKIMTFMGLPISLVKAVLLLWREKPDFVLGVGGYVSGPVTLMASLMGYRTLIWEPNAIPGITNRWLSSFVKTSLVVFEEAEKFLKGKQTIRVGMPVRESIEKVGDQKSTSEAEGAGSKESFHVLIFGGSQGARAINQVVQDLLLSPPDWRKGIRFRHQTGALDYKNVLTRYEEARIEGVECFEYFHDMEAQYQWADLVICRSGASTVAEIAASAKPALFVPLPWAADNHQKKNAEVLVRANAAAMIEQKDLNSESLKNVLMELMDQKEKRHQMSQNVRQFHTQKAAEKIVEILVSR